MIEEIYVLVYDEWSIAGYPMVHFSHVHPQLVEKYLDQIIYIYLFIFFFFLFSFPHRSFFQSEIICEIGAIIEQI